MNLRLRSPVSEDWWKLYIDDRKMVEEVPGRIMQRIRSQTLRLDAIIQDLLQLSRFDSSERQKDLTTVRLSSVMQQVHQSKFMDADVELTLDLKKDHLKVEGETEALN